MIPGLSLPVEAGYAHDYSFVSEPTRNAGVWALTRELVRSTGIPCHFWLPGNSVIIA